MTQPASPPSMSDWRLWGAAASGCILLATAFPPIDLPWVAWIAPLPWLWLVTLPQLPGKRPYLVLWLLGFAFWAWLLQGIRLAHPALVFGWLALAAYVGVYLPLFIGMTRQAVIGWKIPLFIAAPAVWSGLEVIRAYFLTGFALGLLGHTQTASPAIMQVATVGGAYAVSFVLMAFAASLIDIPYRWKQDWWAFLWLFFVVVYPLGAGFAFLSNPQRNAKVPPLRVVLVQGSLDTVFEFNPERIGQTLRHYRELTTAAKAKFGHFDLLVWPESSCPAPYLKAAANYAPPAEAQMTTAEFSERLTESNRQFENLLQDVVAEINHDEAPTDPSDTALLLGCSSFEYTAAGPPHSYNTALWTDGDGHIAGTYHKMHPVMFGEYIPLADWFPILYRITPMPGGLTPGKQAEVMQVGEYRLAPSICFESTVPHLIRRQVADLRARNEEPDLLINITNDGWFWGSSILDLHLRCAIFRAVENRKPMLVAANTGISAFIDGNGVVQQRGPKRQTDLLLAEVRPDGRHSFYSQFGDVFGWLCALLPLGVLAYWAYQRLFAKKTLTHK